MGSNSDLPVMQPAAEILSKFGVNYHLTVVSAHRTPDRMRTFALNAKNEGFKVIIAGAGGAAHLPGMVASLSTLPVIGVPVSLKNLEGMDSLLSIVQMPAGIPVATVGIDNAKNAGILAARIIGSSDANVAKKVEAQLADIREEAKAKGANLTARRNTKTGF